MDSTAPPDAYPPRYAASGDRIRARVKALDVPQREIARRAGLSWSTYQRCTQGREPGVGVAVPLARALGVSIEDLWPSPDVPRPSQRRRVRPAAEKA